MQFPASAQSIFFDWCNRWRAIYDVVNATNRNNLSFIPKSTNFTIGPHSRSNLR